MKNNKRSLVIMLILVLTSTLIPVQSYGIVKSVAKPVTSSTLMSSDHLKHNFVKITAKEDVLEIECETPIKAITFGINVRRVVPSSSKSKWIRRVYPSNEGNYYRFSENISASEIGANGDYVLVITMLRKTGSESEVFYKNCNFRVKNGKISILKYNTILNANKNMRKKGNSYKRSLFTDKYLGDVRNILFRDPKTGKVAKVTKAKVAYFRKVSNAVTRDAKNNYEKVVKIYKYVADKFYYDDIAFATGKNQYLDPYRNLYNLRNKKKSANSTNNGKVATVCVGNAGIVVALARAQGIPARIVNGHHVGLGADRYYNWSNEKNLQKIDHWWAEVYVNNRWIVVDPTAGSGNRWNRSTGKWTYKGVQNYIYMDPTIEQLSTSHITYNIKGKGL